LKIASENSGPLFGILAVGCIGCS